MKKFSKLLLGAAILGVGIGGVGLGILSKTPSFEVKAASTTASSTISAIAKKNNWTNTTAYTSWNLDDNVTISTSGTGNNGKYYSSDSTWRLYSNGNGNLIITVADSYALSSVTVAFSGSLTGLSSGKATTVSGSTVTYPATAKNDNITSISVTYASTSTDYVTNLGAILNEASFVEGTRYNSSSQIAATATVNGTANPDYTNFKAEVGTKTGETYVKRTDLVDQQTRFLTNDNVIRVTALDPTVAGGSTYESVDLALTITASTDYYTLVTGLSDLRIGSEIVFGNISAGVAMSTTLNATDHNIGKLDVAIIDNRMINATGVNGFSFGVGSTKDSYTFKSKSNSQYLYNDSTNTSYLGTQATNDVNGEWAISFDATDHHVTLTSQGTTATYLEYYTNAFTTYKYVPSKAEAEIFMYQKVASLGSLSSLSLVTNPTKTQYSTGETFDKTGIKVNAVFDDASSTTVDASNWITFPTDLFVGGETKITGTVNVLGVSKTLDVTIQVETVTLTSIGITTPASKLTYLVGETLDTTGIVVTATYSNNNTTDVTASCTFSPANGSTLSTAGTTIVMVTFEGRTTSYEVTVNTPTTYVFYKVESAEQLKAGAHVLIGSTIAAESGNTVTFMSTTQNTNNRGQTAPANEANTYSFAENSSTAAVFTVETGTAAGTFAFKDAGGYIYAASSSSNNLKSQSSLDANGSWTVTYKDGASTIKANGTNTRNLLQYNKTSSIFSAYASATQTSIDLFVDQATYEAQNTEILNTYVTSFNNTISPICTAGQNNTTASSDLTTAWGTETTAYAALPTAVKTTIKGATANASGTAIEQCVARYDFIVGKYSTLTDFMSRSSAQGIGNFSAPKESNNALIISIIGGLTALSGAAFIFYKKKRAQ